MNIDHFLTSTLDAITASGFSTAAVCREAGIDPSLVSRWKAGTVEPRISSLNRLNKAIHDLKQQKIAQLLGGDT